MKKYVRPQLIVEQIMADTAISSVCTDCPTDVDCVSEGNAGAYFRPDGSVSWCNYGNLYAGCV